MTVCTKRNIQTRRGKISFGIGSVMVLTLSLCYGFQPDRFAALTIYPPWFWILPAGILILLAGFWKKRFALGLTIAWLIFLMVFVEQVTSFPRSLWLSQDTWQTARKNGQALRVISLNCNSQPEAMETALEFEPDILLLQEPPGRKELLAVLEKQGLSNHFTQDYIDTPIVVTGDIEQLPVAHDNRIFISKALVTISRMPSLQVVNVRLSPAEIGMNLFFPACWRNHYTNRLFRRQEIEKILQEISFDGPVILGGDFNAPAASGVFDRLKPHFRDSFQAAGVGLGNTIIESLPLLRIDQIWLSRHFQPVSVRSRPCSSSDHRMVICDLIFRPALEK